ncbi:hypothetical protein QFC20_007608 [Naganishia adeliensis]|uniref:Uncharacterized protein n=1 Tax=Naganishia adeliensis TaxID=92952 RepID=A0ACC2UXD9_9TREE|nr:hypothetical protein QFC20_007608 [Naganishia adeliensis]
MRTYDVPPALIINGDQTGVNLFPSDNRTCALKGSKQVAVLGQDDKRHMTLMVTSAMDGTLLLFQAVIKGKTSQSLPKPANRKVAEEWGMFFKCGQNKYWATLQTTKDHAYVAPVTGVDEIVVRYIEKVKREKSLPDDQFAILYIDAWAVHRSEAFHNWMRERHPIILLVFVPATCTGVLRPADVGLQRVIKHRLKALFAEWLTKKVGELKDKEVSTPNLRELVPMIMTQALLAVKSRQDLVKKSWSKCEVGSGNERISLNPEEIEFDAMKRAFQAHCKQNPMFAMQFAQSNLSPDEAYEHEDAQYEDDETGEDDVGVTPEELEAALLLGIGSARVFRDETDFVVSAQGDMLE